MAFKKGQSGNPGGRPKEKLFADAPRMEIKAAGEDHKRLRKIGRQWPETPTRAGHGGCCESWGAH